MGNVNLPTPVALAGGALCVVGGYLLGVVAGPDASQQSTATVVSFDSGSGRLCLTGDQVDSLDAETEDGVLCGTWRRPYGATTPRKGDAFRFVVLSPDSSDGHTPVTLIYGDVAPATR